jgi:hypothetical protein
MGPNRLSESTAFTREIQRINLNTRASRSLGHIGRGISGKSSPQILPAFEPTSSISSRASSILWPAPNIAEATGRETDDEIEGYISNMIELAQLHGIKVVLASIPLAANFFWHTGLNPAPRIRVFNN